MENKWTSLLIRPKDLFPAGIKFVRVFGLPPYRDLPFVESDSNVADNLPADTNEEDMLRLALEVWESEGGALAAQPSE